MRLSEGLKENENCSLLRNISTEYSKSVSDSIGGMQELLATHAFRILHHQEASMPRMSFVLSEARTDAN
jgi:hypothetical protein